MGSAADDVIGSAADALEQQKILMRQAETKIRLLAPSPTFKDAETLRLSIRRLANTVGADLTASQFEDLADAINDHREVFVRRAKKAMSLPK